MEPTASVPSWPCKNLLSWSLILTKLYKPLLPSSWGQNRVKRLARKNSEVKIIVFLHPSDNPEKWQSSISAAWRSNGWKWGTGKLTDIVPLKGTSNKKGKPVSSHCWSVTKFALKCVFKDPPEDIVKSPAGMSPSLMGPRGSDVEALDPQLISAKDQSSELRVQGSFLSSQLTYRKSVHPAPSVGCELHGHSWGGKGVNQCSLRCVSTRPNM